MIIIVNQIIKILEMKKSVEMPQPKNEVKEVKKITLEDKQNAKEQVNALLGSVISPEKRISDLKILNKLSEKLEFLRKKNEEFSLFVASTDQTVAKITIQNSQGYEFTMSNTHTFDKVIEVIEKDLDEVTRKAEQEFLNFSI